MLEISLLYIYHFFSRKGGILLKWVIERPVLSGMLFLSILLIGIYSFKNTPIELVPEEKLPSLTITDFWYGASPDMILEKLALPIEEQISGIKGLEKIETSCIENQLRMKLEFSRNTNMEFAYLLVKEKLNKVKKNLPSSARATLDLKPFVPKDFEKKPFLSVGIFSKMPLQAIRNIAEREFLPKLKGIHGVSHIELWGGAEPELKVLLDPERMKLYGISVYEVYYAINQNFYTLPSISMESSGGEVSLTLSSSAASPNDIENLTIVSPYKSEVKLGQIGRVFLSSKDIREEKRYQGMPVVVMDIFKEKGASSLRLASLLKQKISGIESRLGGMVHAKIIEDESEELSKRLDKLIRLSLLILVIIFSILIIVFRDFKPSLLVFSSVVFSVFAAFTLIYILKIPVNLLTLSGFALGFGMFVDNAVVVFENIMRLREGGMDKLEASIRGAQEVILPVIASTATTIIVFFSFAYFQGRLRLYYLPLAYTITIALASSVIVAFTLIPSIAVRMNFKVKEKGKKHSHKVFSFGVRYPLFILIPVALIFFFSQRLFYKNVTFGRFFSWYQKQKLQVYVQLPPGSTFRDTKKTILQFEELALSKPYRKEVKTQISGNYAYMEVEFPEEIEFSAYPYMLKQELIQLATNMAGIGVGVYGFDPQGYYYSPYAGSWLPYSIVLKGYNFERLTRIAESLRTSLLMHRRINETRVVYQKGYYSGQKRKYYSMVLDFDALRRYQINPRVFMYNLSSLIRAGGFYQRVKIASKEMDLEVRPDVQEPELDELLSTEFISTSGIPYRVSQVVNLSEKEAKGGIDRENQEYIAVVQWDYLGSYKKGEALEKTIFKNLALPPGFTKTLEVPSWWLKSEELEQIKFAIVIALVLIFILLSMLYESVVLPFVVMMAIPLALIGVFFGFSVSDFPFDSTAYIGLILLFGIVVNNAIILVDHTNNYLRKGNSPSEAAVKGAVERIRPIFITSATTVLGMLPLVVFHKGAQTDIWTTLALCTVGGLTASALLVPLVIPIFYNLSFKLRKMF